MWCPRCHGLMFGETFYDWTDYRCFKGWRCICCGNVWDRVIAANRAHAGEVFMSSGRRCRLPVRVGSGRP